jgi:predicted phosphodiesterase
MRTFVIADAHGYPELIENALDHGRFEPGRDAFVYAGDLIDRGPDGRGCIALVERYADEVLLGNHDVAVLLGLDIFPQDWTSPALRSFFAEKVLPSGHVKAWKLAACVEGVLITHAGVSSDYGMVFREECRSDPGRLADFLNRAFLNVVKRDPPVRDWADADVLDEHGPLWFRPWPFSPLRPLMECTQVAGHTPARAGVEVPGFYMIDPGASERVDERGRYCYAIIEGGEVRVEDSTVRRDGGRG